MMLIGLVLYILIALGIARYVLGPVASQRRKFNARVQFMLSDLAWLVLLLQLALAAVVAYIPRENSQLFAVYFGFAFCASLAMWWGTMRMVSQVGVRSQLRRGTMIVLVVPLTLAIMVGWFPASMYVLFAILPLLSSEVEPDSPAMFIGILLLGIIGFAPLCLSLAPSHPLGIE